MSNVYKRNLSRSLLSFVNTASNVADFRAFASLRSNRNVHTIQSIWIIKERNELFKYTEVTSEELNKNNYSIRAWFI